MGLDNGIIMKVKIKAEWVETLGIKESEFEIAYWRKCWNFRNDVMAYFDSSSEEYAYPMTVDDLDGIDRIISEQIENKVSEMIWDKKETKSIHKANRKMIRNCMLLNTYGGEMAMVKYDGFDMMGGQLSFVLAFLDENDNVATYSNEILYLSALQNKEYLHIVC